MEIIDKSTSMWGWGRITASLAALIAFGAVTMGDPSSAPDTTALADAGSKIIDSTYVLIAQVSAFVAAATALWSKIRPMMSWVNKDGTKKK